MASFGFDRLSAYRRRRISMLNGWRKRILRGDIGLPYSMRLCVKPSQGLEDHHSTCYGTSLSGPISATRCCRTFCIEINSLSEDFYQRSKVSQHVSPRKATAGGFSFRTCRRRRCRRRNEKSPKTGSGFSTKDEDYSPSLIASDGELMSANESKHISPL